MKHRQTGLPRKWLVADERLGDQLWRAVDRLPRGGGILFLYRDLPRSKRARLLMKLRRLARNRSLTIADEAAGEAARVHNAVEFRRAALAAVPLLFLSPMHRTRSHRAWKPLTRMRAAALLRLANAPVIALGGMNEQRFDVLEPLGFSGWAGMDAWIRA